MRWRILSLIIIITAVSFIGQEAALAQTTPINIALFNPIQIFPDNQSVAGFRWNILYGKNAGLVGLDIGLVNHIGTGGLEGLQWGFVNLVNSNLTGLQWGAINITQSTAEGFQWGWYNSADHMSGFQLGLVNYAVSMKGLQIGLVNIIKTGGQFPVFPIVNWSF